MANGSSFNIPSDWDCRDMGHDDEAPAPERAASPPRVEPSPSPSETAGASQVMQHNEPEDVMRLFEIGERDSLIDAWRGCYDSAARGKFYVAHESDLRELLRERSERQNEPQPAAPSAAPPGRPLETYTTLEEVMELTRRFEEGHVPPASQIRRLLATAKAGLEARAERDALRAEPSEDDVQRACDVYSSWPNNPRVQAHADVRRRSLRAALVDFIARRTRSGRASSSEGGTSNG